MLVRKENPKRPDRFDWIPMMLRTVSGFNSCVTVAVTSVIFMVTIRDAVLSSEIGWFNGWTIAMMAAGPVVITWHFTNAKGMIEKVLRTPIPTVEDSEVTEVKIAQNSLSAVEEMTCTSDCHRIPSGANIITERDIGIERELFGLSTIILRALAGFISCHTICLGSIIYTFTIRSAVVTGGTMPGNIEVLVAIIGPIITSWSFMRAANTISVLISGTTALVKMRERLAAIISPK